MMMLPDWRLITFGLYCGLVGFALGSILGDNLGWWKCFNQFREKEEELRGNIKK